MNTYGVRPELVCTSAENMDLPPAVYDAVLWGNGIHYLTEEEQRNAIVRIKKVLRSEGWLFFNTAFYANAKPSETLPFYRAKILAAVRRLRDSGRSRGESTRPAEASREKSADHYRSLLLGAGFRLESLREQTVKATLAFWEAICRYTQYAEGALHGYPVEPAADALGKAVADVFPTYKLEEDGISYIPRNWLTVIARA